MKTREAVHGTVDHERRTFAFEKVKLESRQDGDRKVYTKLQGYATTWQVIETLGEEMVKGAFSKTVSERVPARRVKLLDSHMDTADCVLGTITSAKEDSFGLFIEAELSETPRSQDVARKCDEGHLKWLSIGFRTVRDEFVRDGPDDYDPLRRILEAKMYEVSVVPFPADEDCEITSVRSVVPFQDLPLAPPSTAWDPDAARARMVKAATDRSAKDEVVNLQKTRRAFLWHDRADPFSPASYRVQVADLVDGKLSIVPRAVLDADLEAVPAEARSAVREHLERYMVAIRKADPGALAAWEPGGALEALALKCRSGVSDEASKTRVRTLLGKLPDQVRADLAAALTAAPPPPGAPTVDGAQSRKSRARALALSLEL